MHVVCASFNSLQSITKRTVAIAKTAKLLGGKTLMSSYILCKFWGFSETMEYIGLKFSEITEIVILFQYSRISF